MSEEKPTALQDYSDYVYRLCMRDTGEEPLLTRDDEVRLATIIKTKGLESPEGVEAFTQMVKANLRLVYKISKRFMNCGLPHLDLLSEGKIGLMIGVREFDHTRSKLSVYVSYWIRHSITRALSNQARTVRLSVKTEGKLRKLRRVSKELFQIHGRDPTDDELADELGMSMESVQELRGLPSVTHSLNEPIGVDGDGATLEDLTVDHSARHPSKGLIREERIEQLIPAIATLEEEDQQIIFARFGFTVVDGEIEETTVKALEELAVDLEMTQQGVRARQMKALIALARRMGQHNPRIIIAPKKGELMTAKSFQTKLAKEKKIRMVRRAEREKKRKLLRA